MSSKRKKSVKRSVRTRLKAGVRAKVRTPAKSASRKAVRKPVQKRTPKTIRTVRIPSAEVLRERERIAAAKRAYKKAVRFFRPKKTERGSVVVLAARPRRGKVERLGKSSRKQGYAVYVTRLGTVKPLVERGKRVPLPRTRKGIDPADFRSKTAREAGQRALFSRVSTRRGLSRVFTPGRGRTSVDWLKVQAGMVEAMAQAVRTNKRAHTQVFSSSVVVKTADGMRTFGATTNLHLSDAQARMDLPSDWEGFHAKSLEQYSIIAEQLAQADMVTKGSAESIGELEWNDGEEMVNWMDERGRRWEKNEMDVVDVKSWSFEVGVGQIEGKSIFRAKGTT